MIQLCIYIHSFHIIFHYGLLQDIEYSSLCYTVGTCWLYSNLNLMLKVMPYVCTLWQLFKVLRYRGLGCLVVFPNAKLHNSPAWNCVRIWFIFPTLILHCYFRFQIISVFRLLYKFNFSLIKLKSKQIVSVTNLF